jgi:hypothetical protein
MGTEVPEDACTEALGAAIVATGPAAVVLANARACGSGMVLDSVDMGDS